VFPLNLLVPAKPPPPPVLPQTRKMASQNSLQRINKHTLYKHMNRTRPNILFVGKRTRPNILFVCMWDEFSRKCKREKSREIRQSWGISTCAQGSWALLSARNRQCEYPPRSCFHFSLEIENETFVEPESYTRPGSMSLRYFLKELASLLEPHCYTTRSLFFFFCSSLLPSSSIANYSRHTSSVEISKLCPLLRCFHG